MLTCAHCNKRLTRKGARLIDGVVTCYPCMIAPRNVTSGSAQDAKRLDPKGAGTVREADAPMLRHAP